MRRLNSPRAAPQSDQSSETSNENTISRALITRKFQASIVKNRTRESHTPPTMPNAFPDRNLLWIRPLKTNSQKRASPQPRTRSSDAKWNHLPVARSLPNSRWIGGEKILGIDRGRILQNVTGIATSSRKPIGRWANVVTANAVAKFCAYATD